MARWAGQADCSLTVPSAKAGGSGQPDLPRQGRTRTMLDEYSRKGGLELEKLGTHGAETPR